MEEVAPLLRAMTARAQVDRFLVHTGQHYDASMSDACFRDLGMPKPDGNLAVGSGSHASQTADVLRAIEPVLLASRPDAVVVVGDVDATLAVTIAAVKLGIPVAHVDARPRSFDRTMPEEIDRILPDSVSRWLFTSEPAGAANLQREGIAAEQIHQRLPIVFPVHPRTRSSIGTRLGDRAPRLLRTDPLGVPCLTMRNDTEHPVAIERGTNHLMGSDPAAILAASCEILDGETRPGRKPELWDGSAAERIVDVLERDLSS